MLSIKHLGITKIHIVTVAKVASSAFYHSLTHKYDTVHRHSLQWLKYVLDNDKKALIISGIRNPLDRAVSYFFQTYCDNFYNDNKIGTNNYLGEYCYKMDKETLLKTDPKVIVKMIRESPFTYTFNDWFKEFFAIVKVKGFNKEMGYQLYALPNNNYLLLYTFEKLNDNLETFKSMFGIDKFVNTNEREGDIRDKYGQVKELIKNSWTDKEKEMLLDTEVIRFFY